MMMMVMVLMLMMMVMMVMMMDIKVMMTSPDRFLPAWGPSSWGRQIYMCCNQSLQITCHLLFGSFSINSHTTLTMSSSISVKINLRADL